MHMAIWPYGSHHGSAPTVGPYASCRGCEAYRAQRSCLRPRRMPPLPCWDKVGMYTCVNFVVVLQYMCYFDQMHML